jgi:IMP dehydrogenase
MRILETESISLQELRLLPRHTPADAGMAHVSLRTRLCALGNGHLELGLPVLSAAMQAVSGPDLAIALAQLGGIGVLPLSQSIDAQCQAAAQVKRYKAGFQTDIVTLSPAQRLSEVVSLMRATGFATFPVTDTGLFHGRLLGVLTDKDFDPRGDGAARVADRMRKDVQVGVETHDLNAANQLMIDYGRGFLPIVSEAGTLLSVVFKKDRDKHLHHPDETVDSDRRLRIAAAVSTHPEDRERTEALLEQEVDVLVIDASDGHTAFQAEMIEWVKAIGDVPVVAGNVVTAEGFDFLADAGADAVKVGMGVGSGCTTQSLKATGRGQATALMDVAAARERRRQAGGRDLPLIADGGLAGPAAIVVALALGADSVMLGNLLARFSESPGQLVRGHRGELFKEYWMEGSKRAANTRRYAHATRDFFEEGVEGLVPHAGSIFDGVPVLERALRSALATAGCTTIRALHRGALLERQSPASLGDSAVHDLELAPTRAAASGG